MHWILLYVAIAFEVTGTTFLKLSDGLTRLGFFAFCLLCYGISFGLLALALKSIPVGVAYAIWSGFGTLLIVTIGIVWFAEAATANGTR